jgi:hypothetical protein
MNQDNLFRLQSELVGRLTSGVASGGSDLASSWLAAADPKTLELMSLLSLGKRVEKILKLLPRTCAYLKPELPRLAREFAIRHPPLSAESYFNGCQFYRFLQEQWRVAEPTPPFLPDLTYCELALIGLDRRDLVPATAKLADAACVSCDFWVRRRRLTRTHRCHYDIRSLLDRAHDEGYDIQSASVCLALSRPLDGGKARVYNVDEGLFELLRLIGDWTRQSPRSCRDPERTVALYARLEIFGLIEVRLCESQ